MWLVFVSPPDAGRIVAAAVLRYCQGIRMGATIAIFQMGVMAGLSTPSYHAEPRPADAAVVGISGEHGSRISMDGRATNTILTLHLVLIVLSIRYYSTLFTYLCQSHPWDRASI